LDGLASAVTLLLRRRQNVASREALEGPPRSPRRRPRNKAKLIGAKSPLRPKHVWSIRSKLRAQGRQRDHAVFDLAIGSKLRSRDLVSLKVDDAATRRSVAAIDLSGYTSGEPAVGG
jgi:hypothetical protein